MSLTGHHAASCQAALGGGVTRVQVTAVSPTNQGAGAERRICRSQFTQTCEQAQEAAESSDSLAPPPRVLLRHLQLQSPGAAGWVPPPGSPVHFLCGAACCVNTTGAHSGPHSWSRWVPPGLSNSAVFSGSWETAG